MRHKRESLLYHPVTQALIDDKWKSFGKQGFIFSVVFYTLFLSFLTSFALVIPSPQVAGCKLFDYIQLSGLIIMLQQLYIGEDVFTSANVSCFGRSVFQFALFSARIPIFHFLF